MHVVAAPASSAMDGANADQAGAFIGPADEGHCNKLSGDWRLATGICRLPLMPIVLLLFVLIPIAEMWLLIEVGSRIGALPTIGLVLLTAVVGVALLRQQGFSTLMRARQRMESGQIPAREMGEGIFLAVGGALLLTPGFITDFIGFCCLIPGLRQILLCLILRRLKVTQFGAGQSQNPSGEPFEPGRRSDNDQQTLDGEYKRED